MKRFFKEYKLLIITAVITLIVVLSIFSFFSRKKQNLIKEYKNEYYSFQYDSNWKLEDKNKINLRHKSGSTLSIELLFLEDEFQYKNLEEMSSQIFNEIKKQNIDYNLIAEQYLKVTKNYYDGYQMLFEKEDEEVLVVIGKDSEKLFIITYEANNEYFDILLDSVESIIDYFTLTEEVFSISTELNINTEFIPWGHNSLLEKSQGTIEDEIANYNYIVKSKLPTNLQSTIMNSTHNRYQYLNLEENQKLEVSTNIYLKDIYSYLESDNISGLYSSKKDSTRNYKEYLQEAPTEEYNRYIYKNTYQLDDNEYENILLIYEINRNHTFIVEINAKNIEVPEKWIEPIEIISIKNYAGYTDTVKEGDIQQFNLKIFKAYQYDKIEIVSFKLSTKWQEITAQQLQNNIYQSRSFGIDYLSKLDYYLYRVDYYFDHTYSNNLSDAASQQVEIEKNSMTYKYSYGKYEPIYFYKKMTLNGNEFYCYKGGYTDSTNVYVDMVLLYAKTDSGLLKIKVLGNNAKVSDVLLEEITNFEVNEE